MKQHQHGHPAHDDERQPEAVELLLHHHHHHHHYHHHQQYINRAAAATAPPTLCMHLYKSDSLIAQTVPQSSL